MVVFTTGDTQGDRRYLFGEKNGQFGFTVVADRFDIQRVNDLAGGFHQGMVVVEFHGVDITDGFQIHLHAVFVAGALHDVADIAINRFYHLIRIALNLKSELGIVCDDAVFEAAGNLAEDHPGTWPLRQLKLQDLVDHFVENQDGIGPKGPFPAVRGADPAFDFNPDHTGGIIVQAPDFDTFHTNHAPNGSRPGFQQVPDAFQVSIADGLDNAGQNNIRFEFQVQLSEDYRQGGQNRHPQGIVGKAGALDKIWSDLVV